MIAAERNKAFTLRDGDIHQEVDAVRLAVSDQAIGTGGKNLVMRRSATWKFRSQKRGTHFFVTSNGIQAEMKGTIHPTEALFGYSLPIRDMDRTWLGPLPASRHLHVLKINDLKDGESQDVMGISLPGFALMKKPLPFDAGKIVTWSDPHPPNFEVTYGLTVAQGDWRECIAQRPDQVFVGLLTGDSARSALISFNINPYPDVGAAMANMKRNLAFIDVRGGELPVGELTTMFWMDRNDADSIRMIELNGIVATDGKLQTSWG